VADRVPERVRVAVEALAVDPGERLLEIGCGSGVAASLVCERLRGGTMLAIDRSEKQIERARRRNERHLVSGRLALAPVALADLDLGERRFDKIFAVNVNVFWTERAATEIAKVSEALASGGTLLLFYESPGAARARDAAERAAANLRSGGFAGPEVASLAETVVYCRCELG
jgi:cyclopropane fatty-acyl-phospholipid synthase-like methyltransferase